MNSNWTDTREIRKFGAIALVFFGALSGLGFWRQNVIAAIVFGVLCLLGLGFLLLPAPLAPLYRGWLRVAHVIGTVMTALILTLAYYLVITPSGLVKRIISGSPIPWAPDKSAPSYWVPRSEPAQPRERFLKRF